MEQISGMSKVGGEQVAYMGNDVGRPSHSKIHRKSADGYDEKHQRNQIGSRRQILGTHQVDDVAKEQCLARIQGS